MEHADEFAGRHDIVDVADAIVLEFGAGGLVLLGLAGHDRDDDQVLRVDADLLGVVGLGDRAEHLLGRLAGRGDVEQVGVVVLEEVDPARAAGGENRQVLARLHAFDELVALLHDREVGREVGVEDLVEAEGAETGYELARDGFARLESEFLADGDANRRGGLDDDGLGGVVEGRPDLLDVGDADDGADRADVDALAAEGAGAVGQRNHRGRADLGGETAAVAGEGADGLDLVADGLAAAAHDALVEVAHDGRGLVDREGVGLALELDLADAELGGELLEFALLVLGAGEAGLGVVGEEKLEDGAAGVAGALRIRPDLHVVGDRGGAGRREDLARAADAGGLDKAEAAGGGLVGHAAADIRTVAEGRDLDVELLGGIENRRAGGNRDLKAVDFDCDVSHC